MQILSRKLLESEKLPTHSPNQNFLPRLPCFLVGISTSRLFHTKPLRPSTKPDSQNRLAFPSGCRLSSPLRSVGHNFGGACSHSGTSEGVGDFSICCNKNEQQMSVWG